MYSPLLSSLEGCKYDTYVLSQKRTKSVVTHEYSTLFTIMLLLGTTQYCFQSNSFLMGQTRRSSNLNGSLLVVIVHSL